MAPIRVILVPVDFSPHSDAALDQAMDLAKALGARIHLLHSYAVPVRGVMPYDFAIPDGVWDGIHRAAESKLEEIRQKVASEGVEASTEVSAALPSEAILAAADRIDADTTLCRNSSSLPAAASRIPSHTPSGTAKS